MSDHTGSPDEPADPGRPFHDLDAFAALPRISGLHLSPAGDRLIAEVATLGPAGSGYVSALWQIDPTGGRPATRLTRSAKGESFAAFGHDGTVLFTSQRPDPATKPEGDEPPASLWALPAAGEAFVVASREGGFGAVATARDAATVVLTAMTMPGTTDGADGTADAGRRTARKDAKVMAILHETYPVRHWASDLGPDAPRLLSGSLDVAAGTLVLRELAGHSGHALRDVHLEVGPDGATAVTTWERHEAGGSQRVAIAVVDLATGTRRVILDHPDHEFATFALSPDGSRLAVVVTDRISPHDPGDHRLAVVDIPSGGTADLTDLTDLTGLRYVTPGWDRWPETVAWTPDGSALIVTADEAGRSPVFRVDLTTDAAREPIRLTGDDAAYTDVAVSPDGATVYALRSAVDAPPGPVRFDSRAPGQTPQRLAGPTPDLTLPGRLVEVTTAGLDGTPIRAWLCLPPAPVDLTAPTDPPAAAPLALWIHGGPQMSWNAWSWRWNPWLMVARGYAVLLPDPGLSTGYGKAFVARGWGAWGQAPYTDVMALTDAAGRHPGVDADRAVVMGGSFGGYLTNWVLGHTDRFLAAVTHAGLYALDQFGATTDAAFYWRREMTDEMALANSPHRHMQNWTTPTLVVHGDRDYRVPIGEALRLWWDLAARSGDDDGTMPHKFLYFPDEGHWVLTPAHTKLWYDTVFAFLDHHVHGVPWQTPELLT